MAEFIDVEVEDVVWTLEDIVMGHRYLYYILGSPVISDYEYDQLDTHARKVLPTTSHVHEIGSSLSSSYTPRQVACACLLKSGHIWT